MTAPAALPQPPSANAFDELDRPRRPWWILVLLLVLAAGAGGWWWYTNKHKAPPAKRYVTAQAVLAELVETVEATGTVQPLQQVQISSQVSGRVLSVHVDFNYRVRHGDVLAELDPQPFQNAVAQARAAVTSAQASYNRTASDLTTNERALARAQELRTRNLNAQADVDAALGARNASRAQLAVSRAEIARANAGLETALTNLTYTHILSPIDGVVITRAVDPGSTVAASLSAPVLFVIANDLTQMRVIADVDEADVGKLRNVLAADVRVDAYQGENFPGTLRDLRYGPTTTNGVVTYPAVIDVANPEGKLRPGMTATVTLTTQRHEDVIAVPNAALRFRPSDPALNQGGGGGRGGRGGRDGDAGVRGGDGDGGYRRRRREDAGAAGPHEGPDAGAASSDGGAGVASSDGGTTAIATGTPDAGPPPAPVQFPTATSPSGRPGAGQMGRVFVLRNGQPVAVRVRIGITQDNLTEVESPDLQPGMEIIVDEVDSQGGGAGGAGGRPGGGGAGGGGGGGRGGAGGGGGRRPSIL